METNRYLDLVKDRYNLPSDYKLAQKLDISRHRLSAYRTTNRNMDDELCLTIEKLLKLPQGAILLDIHAQRSKCSSAKRLFEKLSKQLISGGLAASLALSAFQFDGSFSSNQSEYVIMPNTVYYVKYQNALFHHFFLSSLCPLILLLYGFRHISKNDYKLVTFITAKKAAFFTRPIEGVNGSTVND